MSSRMAQKRLIDTSPSKAAGGRKQQELANMLAMSGGIDTIDRKHDLDWLMSETVMTVLQRYRDLTGAVDEDDLARFS